MVPKATKTCVPVGGTAWAWLLRCLAVSAQASTHCLEETYKRLQAAGALPTHVFKFSANMSDWTVIGTYLHGAPGQPGRAHATPGFEDLFVPRIIDAGKFYASKDGVYPPPAKASQGPQRRVNWGWAMVPPDSAQTLPRLVTFNPDLRQLEWTPVPEQDSLRKEQLAMLADMRLLGDLDLKLPQGSASQSELEVVFDLSGVEQGVFGVRLLRSDGLPSNGVHFFANYSGRKLSSSWSDVAVIVQDANNSRFTDVLRLHPKEQQLSIRLYMDNTFSEVYFQDGRIAMTVPTADISKASLALTATTPIMLKSARAWSVGDIWVSPERVLSTPRLDRPRGEVLLSV